MAVGVRDFTMPPVYRRLAELMAIVSFTINTVLGQIDIPWSLCETETEGIFCIGASYNQTYQVGTGCLMNKDCGVLVIADATPLDKNNLTNTLIRWHFYNNATIVSPTLTPGMIITFMVTKVQPTSLANDFAANTLVAYTAYPTTGPVLRPIHATHIIGSNVNTPDIYRPDKQTIGQMDTNSNGNRFTYSNFTSPVVLRYSTRGVEQYKVNLFTDSLYVTLVHRSHQANNVTMAFEQRSLDNLIQTTIAKNLFNIKTNETSPQSSGLYIALLVILIVLAILITGITVIMFNKKNNRFAQSVSTPTNSSVSMSDRSQLSTLPSGMDSHISAAPSQAETVVIVENIDN